jgi:cytochrome P450
LVLCAFCPDTTAVALTYLFWQLDQHPSEAAVCVEEIARVIGDDPHPSAAEVKRLLRVEAAFLEGLRLYSPVPQDCKQCARDITFPCGTRIPAGARVFYSPHVLHRLPSFYESCPNPVLQTWAADCRIFKPSRWLVPKEPADGHASEGSRRCLSGDAGVDVVAADEALQIVHPTAFEFVTFNAGE